MIKYAERLLDWLSDAQDNLWCPTKWALQCLVRGWDDRVIWSIDWHLATMMPTWLRRLKEIQCGVPTQFEDAPEKWDAVLDTIIDGFEAAKQIREWAFPAWDSLAEQERDRYGRELDILNLEDRAKIHIVEEAIGFRELLQGQEDDALRRFHKGMDLFKEHFFDLWD